jgi:hypothetical protein
VGEAVCEPETPSQGIEEGNPGTAARVLDKLWQSEDE